MHPSPTHHWITRARAAGLIGLLASSLAGCGGSGTGSAPLSLAANLSEADAEGIVTVNLTGLPPHDEAIPASAFTVFENGSARTIVSVEKIDGNARAGADIAFVLDTTESMKSAIDGAKDSILGFVDYLDAKGLDVQVGAVTFGDAFDTQNASAGAGVSLRGSTPPAFDVDARPSFELGSGIEDFKAFLTEQQARGGAKKQENALGALEFAYEKLDWRPGAQRILIVVTDTCSYTSANFGEDGITDPWIPRTTQQVLARLKGQAMVHVIAPKLVLGCPFLGYADVASFTGAAGTGGVHVEWDGKSQFRLDELPLTPALTAGYLVRYLSSVRGQRSVRVAVDHGDLHGEAVVNVGTAP
jgi:hypothetical protein